MFTTGGLDGEVTRHGAQHDTAAIGRGQTELRTHGTKRQRISLDQVDAASTGVGAQSVYLCFNGVRTIPQHPDPMTRKELEARSADIERTAIAIQNGACGGSDLRIGGGL